MNIALRTSIFVVIAAVMTILAGVLCSTPANAAGAVALPGENLSAKVQDNPLATNNGEGHDLDDIEELKEHWRKPEYLDDQHRQIAGMVVIIGSVAGFGLASRKIAGAK